LIASGTSESDHSGSARPGNFIKSGGAMQGHSQRKIAEAVGVSHPTVGRILKALKQDNSDE
jgi:transposase